MYVCDVPTQDRPSCAVSYPWSQIHWYVPIRFRQNMWWPHTLSFAHSLMSERQRKDVCVTKFLMNIITFSNFRVCLCVFKLTHTLPCSCEAVSRFTGDEAAKWAYGVLTALRTTYTPTRVHTLIHIWNAHTQTSNLSVRLCVNVCRSRNEQNNPCALTHISEPLISLRMHDSSDLHLIMPPPKKSN